MAGQPHNLLGCIVELVVADQMRFAASQHFLLDVSNRHHLRKLLGLAAVADADIDCHVVARAPLARVNLHPLIAQPHRLRLAAVLADQRVKQRENILDAGFRNHARDQLHARLRHREHLVHGGCALILERVGVDALSLSCDARAHFARAVPILQRRIDAARNIRHNLPVEAARLLGAHDAARARHQQVIQRVRSRERFGDLNARIVVQIEIIQLAAQQRSLDPLNVHHGISQRAPPETMRDRNRRARRKRDHVARLNILDTIAPQDFAALPARRHAVELRLSVVLVVEPNVMLRHADKTRSTIRGRRRCNALALVNAIARNGFNVRGLNIRIQALDLIGVVAFLNQVALGLGRDLVKAIIGIADRARHLGDAEFLGRDRHDAGLRHLLRRQHGHVMRHLALIIGLLRMLDNLHVAIALQDLHRKHGKRIVGLIVVRFPALVVLVLPPDFDDAVFLQQRVLDEGIQRQEARVLLHENVVDVIRFLLRRFLVLRSHRLETHNLVRAAEDVHQGRHKPFDGIGNVSRDSLRAPLGRRHVLFHAAVVIVHRIAALASEFCAVEDGGRCRLLG